ncbi:hypothetical protein [Microbispora bryophytorum]|nr:hypothetical protein [Microbispora bryophytorum]
MHGDRLGLLRPDLDADVLNRATGSRSHSSSHAAGVAGLSRTYRS